VKRLNEIYSVILQADMMAMARLGANRLPRRPSRFTVLGLYCLVLKI